MEFLQYNSLYVVALIAVIIWFGLFLFLVSLSKRVKRLEASQRHEPSVTRRS
jgi:CcmD family protein